MASLGEGIDAEDACEAPLPATPADAAVLEGPAEVQAAVAVPGAGPTWRTLVTERTDERKVLSNKDSKDTAMLMKAASDYTRKQNNPLIVIKRSGAGNYSVFCGMSRVSGQKLSLPTDTHPSDCSVRRWFVCVALWPSC
jgi:hypothetical protein